MSCDSRRRRAWKALATGDQAAARLDPRQAERLLREAFDAGRGRDAPASAAEIENQRARTAVLMDRMRRVTGEVPAHGQDDPRFGVPVPVSAKARAGYAAALDALDQIEGRSKPVDPEIRVALGQHRYPGAEITAEDLPRNPNVQTMIDRFAARGMSARPAGGCVRDNILGKWPKDFDVEVYGGDKDKIVGVLQSLGLHDPDPVGKSFGVFKLPVAGEAEDVDVSMPRTDSKAGQGHKGVDVTVDPNMLPADACKRRDLTFNAMLHDTDLGVTVDYYGGRRDLAEGRIRHVDESFRDDPLRALRAARFASVYSGRLEPETAQMCRSLKDEYATLPDSRLQGEWNKLVQGKSPASGIRALHDMGWDEHTPELAAARVEAEWHATRAVEIADEEGLAPKQRAQHVYAAIGSTMGPEGAERFMSAIGESRMRSDVAAKVVNVVREQDVGRAVAESDAQVRALARRLHPATVRDWALHQRTIGHDGGGRWTAHAEALGVADAPEKRWVEGRDILPHVSKGTKPGPWTGQMVSDAAQAQEDGAFRDMNGAQAWITARLRADGRA